MKKLLLLLVAAFFCMAASADQYVNVVGDFNNWGDNGKQPNADGITKHENLEIGTSPFKIKTWDGSDTYYSTGGAIAQNQWVTVGTEDANMTIQGATAGQRFNVEWNWNTHQIRVTPATGTVTTSWCIHGNVATGSWADIELTESNGKWTAGPLTWRTGEFGVKQLENGSQKAWWSAPSNARNLVLDTPMTLQTSGNGNINVTEAGTYYVSFDPATHQLTASHNPIGGNNPTPGNYDGWYVNVEGTFNGWVDNGIAVPADGLTKHEGLKISTKGFKVKIWNGSENVWYGNGAEVAQGQWVALDEDTTDLPCMTVTGAQAGDIFSVEYDCANNKVKVTKTGNEPENNEVTYCIHGSLASAEWADLALTETDGKWVANDVTVVAGQFGVKKLVGGIQDGWYNATAATTVSETTTVNLEKDGGNNISIAAGTYSFSLDPATMALTITKAGGPTPPPATDWANTPMYIRGAFNGWGYDETADKMTWNGSAYTITKASLEGQFAFSSTDWAHKFTYADVTISGNAADKIIDGSDDHNFATTEALSNVTFTLNPEAKTLTVTVEGTNPPVPDLSAYWVTFAGTYNGWVNDGVQPDQTTGLVSQANQKVGADSFKVKVWNGTEDLWLSTGGAIAQGQWVAITDNIDPGMTIEGAVAGDIFTIEFNVLDNSVKVTKTGHEEVGEPVYSYGLKGSWTGDPNTWTTIEMTESNGVWTATDVEATATTSFGIPYLKNDVQQAWYASAGTADITLSTPMAVAENGTNFSITAAGKYNFSFDPAAMTLTVTNDSAGIEGVEAEAAGEALYFNLQGVRILNPAEGQVYIRVLDGKASKVVR